MSRTAAPVLPRGIRARGILVIGSLALMVALPTGAGAQRVRRVSEALMREVMPEATRFEAPSGDPPVVRAWRTGPDGEEVLHGWVFLTSDLPPEQFGYSGPIEALVGVRTDATITGVRVTNYIESYRGTMGDFLRRPGFQEQFRGKHIGDPFSVWDDVEGISRVSISVRALSRGVRDASRRVAAAYGAAPELEAGAELADPVGRSWFELRQLGVVQRFEVTEPGEGSAGISLAYIENERLGEYFFGPQLFERAIRSAERRGGAEHLILYAIDGSRLRLFRQEGWSLVQDGDTVAVDPGQVVSLGLPSGGVVSGEATLVGLMLVGGEIDTARPFTFVYDLGDLGTYSVEYVSQEARRARAEAVAQGSTAPVDALAAGPEVAAPVDPPASVAAGEARGAVESESAPAPAAVAAPAGEADSGSTSGAAGLEEVDSVGTEAEAVGTGAGEAEAVGAEAGEAVGAEAVGAEAGAADGEATAEQLLPRDFVLTEDESLLDRLISGTSWRRVLLMLGVLALATTAFFTKAPRLRWVSLGVTLLVLGFLDGGFLSVSHITSGIWAGVGVYTRDIPLLLIVTFTLVTTLVWGRVFCGFLCPFGALQDFIERVVPRSWQRPLPKHVHARARWVKYGVLAIILVPAVAGSRVSLYQYFEPFGTVFFRSPSPLLWAIALVFLAASVVVPRFYCRYACPLGASLAILSVVAPRRIARVEQCSLCVVCEQKCPTGAIRREVIDFPECVRCNVCEVQLRERTGVCRHEMDVVRDRLVQIRVTTDV